MALFDDLTKKAAKFTEKTIEKSSELVDTAKTKVSIKSAEADLDDQFIELGKLYYEVLNKDKLIKYIDILIFQDKNMRENDHAGYVDDQSFGRLLSHSPELIWHHWFDQF